MQQKDFLQFMRDITQDIKDGNCKGGSIQFNSMYGVKKGEVEVFASVRTNNSQGQGGACVIVEFSENGILKDFVGINDDNFDEVALSLIPKI